MHMAPDVWIKSAPMNASALKVAVAGTVRRSSLQSPQNPPPVDSIIASSITAKVGPRTALLASVSRGILFARG